jgi:hypothetical protein
VLQINTGKLFSRGIGRTNRLRGVLYSNVRLPYGRSIVTAAGTLLDTDGARGSQAIVYEIEERIEGEAVGPGVLVSHTIAPYLADFAAIASFAFNAIMSPDPALAGRLTSGNPGLASYIPPQRFLSRCFDKLIWLTDSEADALVEIVDELLALDRRTFLAAMRAIRTYVSGVHRLADDLGLAYSLMVSAIEALAQDFDGHESTWEDVDEKKRRPVDAALKRASPRTREAVQQAIVSVEHVSLARRYREFVHDHIGANFFRPAHAVGGRPIAAHELNEALRQAYRLRSKYLHNLQNLPDAIAHPFGNWETASVERSAVLTFEGLSRLTREVLRSFISRGKKLEAEPYDYSRERSGVIMAPLASQYWISRPLSNAAEGKMRLEALLEQLAGKMNGASDAALTDLTPILGDVERQLRRASAKHKPALLGLYILFNKIIAPDKRMPNFDRLVTQYAGITDSPSSEILVVRTILNLLSGWTIEIHRAAYDLYFRERSTPSGLQAPRVFEAAMSLSLAERYRFAGGETAAREMVSRAVEIFPGHQVLQDLEREFSISSPINWRTILLSKKSE